MTYNVASSCVSTSPLAIMTIVGGLHGFVKVSISASLKSFLLILCIDALESTTNSRSPGLRVDAGRHLFSEGEKNVALSCSFNFNTLLAIFHAASRAPCHSVSSCDRSSIFGALGLRWWGSPGQIYPSEGFGSRILVWRAIAFVNFTRWIGFGMSVLFRREDFGGVMSWNTQPNCRASENWRLDEFCPNFLSLLFPSFPGRAIQLEGSERACLDCIGNPGENEIWSTSEFVKCAAKKHGEIRIGVYLNRLLRVKHWRQVVFSREEIRSISSGQWWRSHQSLSFKD